MENLDDDEFRKILENPPPQLVRTLRGGLLKEYLQPIESQGLTLLQKSAIVGTLLGESTLQFNGGRTPYLKFEYGARLNDERSYIDFLYGVFADVVGTPPKPRLKNNKIHSFWFRTFRLKNMLFYANQFYTIDALGKRKKVVPKNIHQMLTPQALSFWLMDDGSLDTNRNLFHTEGFILSDVKILQQALGRIFHLESAIHKDNRETGPLYKLSITPESSKDLRSIVEPYILPSLRYKLVAL